MLTGTGGDQSITTSCKNVILSVFCFILTQPGKIMNNIKLKQLLPAEISNEASFQLVLFIKNLACALEANYFDQMLDYVAICEECKPFQQNDEDSDHLF